MIPAILAVPVVEGVVGNMVGSVAGCFGSSTPDAAPAASFTPYLNRATAAAAPQASSFTPSPTGTMRADQWSQMGASDIQSWMKSLSGSHVNATDATGRTISGVVKGVQQLGHTLALNIGGHLVSLSQLKQVSWSPAVD